MNLDWMDCPNCGATVEGASAACSRCGERLSAPGNGRPRFLPESRDAALDLGGLLQLYEVAGSRVRYVGRCPAGVFGLDESGSLIWTLDWGYMGRVETDGSELRCEGKLVDIDTGRLLPDTS